MQGLISAIEHTHPQLISLSEMSKGVAKNTNNEGCLIIEEQVTAIHSSYSSLKSEASSAKFEVDKLLQDWAALSKADGQLKSWMKDVELKLDINSEFGKDLVEKKLLCDRIKVM